MSLSCFKSACGWLYFLVDVYDRIDTDKFQVFCAALMNMIYLTVSEELADTLVRLLQSLLLYLRKGSPVFYSLILVNTFERS